jgi:hypothetical protein
MATNDLQIIENENSTKKKYTDTWDTYNDQAIKIPLVSK